MWQYMSMAKFLNMTYEAVQELPFDEFHELQYIQQIYNYAQTEEGQQILKDNVRYMCTTPDLNKLRKRFGKESE